MFNTEVVMPGKQGSIKDLCHMLWMGCFDDTEEYTDYYFNNRWNKSITVLSDNVSMLHLNPYDILINGRKTGIYYIVGVCTLKEYRRRGYMDAVLKKTLEFMYKQGKPFTYLMPASEEIYKPYGFTGIYPVRGFNGEIPFKEDIGQDIQCKSVCIPYNMLEDWQKAELIKYAGSKLAGRFTCYPLHNESYFKGLYEEDTILHWMKIFYHRFFQQQFKRSCLPDGPKVGSVAVSPRGDLRMPSDASAGQWMDEVEKL